MNSVETRCDVPIDPDIDYDPENPERPVPGLCDRKEVARLGEVVVIRNCEITSLKHTLGLIADELAAKPCALASTVDPEIISWRQRLIDMIEEALRPRCRRCAETIAPCERCFRREQRTAQVPPNTKGTER